MTTPLIHIFTMFSNITYENLRVSRIYTFKTKQHNWQDVRSLLCRPLRRCPGLAGMCGLPTSFARPLWSGTWWSTSRSTTGSSTSGSTVSTAMSCYRELSKQIPKTHMISNEEWRRLGSTDSNGGLAGFSMWSRSQTCIFFSLDNLFQKIGKNEVSGDHRLNLFQL